MAHLRGRSPGMINDPEHYLDRLAFTTQVPHVKHLIRGQSHSFHQHFQVYVYFLLFSCMHFIIFGICNVRKSRGGLTEIDLSKTIVESSVPDLFGDGDDVCTLCATMCALCSLGRLSIHLPMYLPVFLSIFVSILTICLSVYLSTHLYSLPVYLSMCIPIYLFTYMSIYRSTYLSVYLPIYLSVYLAI